MQTRSIEESAPSVAGLPATPAIHTEGLVKRYGDIAALDGLSMMVPRGEVFGFLGPNGAGKTTAVKLLVGLTRPTAGEARVLGAPIGDREARRKVGYLPELFRYQDWLQAREVLALHCELARIPRRKHAEEIADALDLVGLTGRAGDRVGTFSKGMQQRLGLGVALLGRPELVLLDEPTSALDPVGRHDVRELIRTLRGRGVTVFLNSHLLAEVEQVCDRVAVVDRGRVIAIGTIDELRGGETVLQLRLGAVSERALDLLRRTGTLDIEADGYTIRGISRDAVPELVAQLVDAGCAIYSVQPRGQSLEDRFLELLGGDSADSDHRAPHTS